jgi:glutathione S-transferase
MHTQQGARAIAPHTIPATPHNPTHTQVRHIIYHKGIEADFDIVTPMAVGGLGSQQYAALNPQGKMPILLLPDGHVLPESEVTRRRGGCA